MSTFFAVVVYLAMGVILAIAVYKGVRSELGK